MTLLTYDAMLVVTRKIGERIVIGDQVTITVVRIAGGMVRIGIEAPPTYSIVRRELLDSVPTPAAGPKSENPGRVRTKGGPPGAHGESA